MFEEEMDKMEAVLNPEKIEAKVKVSSKGQVVIPAKIRRAIGIKDGDQELVFKYDNNAGSLTVEKVDYLTADELCGFFNEPEDDDNFILDLEGAREERAEEILNKWNK